MSTSRVLAPRALDVRARARSISRTHSVGRVRPVGCRTVPARRVATAALQLWDAEQAECMLMEGGTQVVSFGTAWCGPCALLAPDLVALGDALEDDAPHVTVAKVDAEEAPGGSHRPRRRRLPHHPLAPRGTRGAPTGGRAPRRRPRAAHREAPPHRGGGGSAPRQRPGVVRTRAPRTPGRAERNGAERVRMRAGAASTSASAMKESTG